MAAAAADAQTQQNQRHRRQAEHAAEHHQRRGVPRALVHAVRRPDHPLLHRASERAEVARRRSGSRRFSFTFENRANRVEHRKQ